MLLDFSAAGKADPYRQPSTPRTANSRTTTRRHSKDKGSVFAGTDVAAWLAEFEVDTITIVGYRTNGDLANEAGKVSAETLNTCSSCFTPASPRSRPATSGPQRSSRVRRSLRATWNTSATQGRAAFVG